MAEKNKSSTFKLIPKDSGNKSLAKSRGRSAYNHGDPDPAELEMNIYTPVPEVNLAKKKASQSTKLSEWEAHWLSEVPERKLSKESAKVIPSWSHEQWEQRLSEGVLNIPHIGLRQVPESIFHFDPPISVVYLHDNNLQTLPFDFFDKLEALSWVDLRNNCLKTLPELSRPHNYLRVILAQNNKLRYLPHSLVLASSLRSISFAGNPLVDPPEMVRSAGIGAILGYFRSKFELPEATDYGLLRAHLEARSEPEIRAQVDDSQILKSLSRKIMGSCVRNTNASQLSGDYSVRNTKKMNKMKYSWELWRDVPFDGVNRRQLMQSAMQDLRQDIVKKFNVGRDSVLQRVKNIETLKKWRHNTRLMQVKSQASMPDYGGLMKPFGSDDDPCMENGTNQLLSPAEFQEEFSACWDKLTDLTSKPSSMTDVATALGRVKEVEAIQRKLCKLKLSLKGPVPL